MPWHTRAALIVALVIADVHATHLLTAGSLDIEMEHDSISLVQLRAGTTAHTRPTAAPTLLEATLRLSNGTAPSPGGSTSAELGQMFAWVMLGRVGSTTMRAVLEHRSQLHGWTVTKEDTDEIRGEDGISYDPYLCHCSSNMLEQNPLKCLSQPTGAVVTTIYYGYCDRIFRPCKYFTLMRDPVARMISDYKHFCRNCAENGLQCRMLKSEKEFWAKGHPGEPLPQTCPKISITEYARRRANPYVRRFSLVEPLELMEGAWSSLGYTREVHEKHYQSALDVLTRDNMLVVWLEELSVGRVGKPNGVMQLSSYMGGYPGFFEGADHVHENHCGRELNISLAEMDALNNILAYDVRLANVVRDYQDSNYLPTGPMDTLNAR